MKKVKGVKSALLTSVVSLFLCVTMLVGTTFAWFTDSVTSANNIIKSGTLKVSMGWAEGDEDPATATYEDASKGAIFNNAKWEPGYSEAKHIKIANEGTLALKYQLRIVANGIVSKLANVIDVYYFAEAEQLDRDTFETDDSGVNLGTLADILGTDKNIAKTVAGVLAKDASTTITLALKMQEEAGNEYQDLSIGTDFSIELIATQASVEEDSFDNLYDEGAPSPEVPAALVRPLEDLDINATIGIGGSAEAFTLNAGYQFEPTISAEDVAKSEYKHWHPDFYVYADRDVPSNSIALAGYYDAWCSLNNDNWVALTNDGMPVSAGADNGVRLVNSLACVTYKDICEYGNDGIGFRCGIAALDEAALAGTTITVEFRLYETEGEWSDSSHTCTEVTPENYIVLGTFTYTYPKTVDTAAGLNEALASGGTINLAAGEYQMPSNQSSTADLTIVGTKETVVDVTLGAYMDSAKVTFKGVTIKTGTGMANGNGSDYAALYTPNVTYEDCTFVGPMRVGRDGAKFINCTFTALGNDYVWTYGNDVTFEGCTFNTDGKAILIYSDGGNEVSKVTVKNCTFNATQGAKAGAIANQNCAAIEIHNYGNGVDLVTEGNTYDTTNFSGEWRIKTYEAGKPKVFVNGTEYTQIAVDGRLMTIDADKNVTVQ